MSEHDEGEAIIISVNDAGEAVIRFAGGGRTVLTLSAEQLSAYRAGQVRARARAGTLGRNPDRPAREGWPSENAEMVIGDRNWFYC